MKQEFSPYFVIYMDLSLGFVTWICLNLNWLLAVTGVMHEADDAYSIRSTWSCYWLDQFLTLALNILILSIFYISMDLSTNYFAHFSGCWASFACSCHYPRMLCHVFWSQVEYKIVCFITGRLQYTVVDLYSNEIPQLHTLQVEVWRVNLYLVS